MLASIIVSVDLGPASFDRVRLACALAQRHGAVLIGAAARLTDFHTLEPARPLDPRYAADEYARVAESLRSAEAAFRRGIVDECRHEWIGAVRAPALHLIEQARRADLLAIGREAPEDGDLGAYAFSRGDVITGAGRPCLVVPPGIVDLACRRIVVAWNDTIQGRRAIRDAIPFLKRAEDILLLSIGNFERDAAGTQDVRRWLKCHGIASQEEVRMAPHDDIGQQILAFAAHEEADLIVCGAYNHSRISEWAFGGVTRHLLEKTHICCLMTH